MDSELTRRSESDETRSSKLSSVNPSDMDSDAKAGHDNGDGDGDNGSDRDTDSDGGDSSIDGDSEAAPQVEWLATGRQRRSTAGNRMNSMLANEEPDSDLELLFAEDENDQGFSDAGDHVSDVQMDSSSDEDDNNNNDDELEGEKELDRQAKERRAAQRKRKAQDAIPAKFRKKVRIDTSTSTPPSSAATPQPQSQHQPRPKKKSERTSWLPSVADMPTRASSRKTTLLSKEQLHAQMEEREAKRVKQLAQMQKKAARLEALKKPPMTQEERLREAAIVEERNSKSLNRWEEAEKIREEERRAKLAALHERTLSGPVLSFWSGMGRFGDGWRKGEGIHVAVEEKPKRTRKEKPAKGGGLKKDDASGNAVKEGPEVDVKSVNAQAASEKTEAANPGQTTIPQAAKSTPAEASDKNGETASTTTAVQDVTTAGAPTAQSPKEAITLPTPEARLEEKQSRPDAPANTAADVFTTKTFAVLAPSNNNCTETQNKAEQSKSKKVEAPSETKADETRTKEEAKVLLIPPTNPGKTAEVQSGAIKIAADPIPVQVPKANEGAHAMTATAGEEAVHKETAKALQPIENGSLPTSKVVSQLQSESATPQPDSTHRSPMDGLATTRNAIIYQNFDGNAIKDKSIQIQVLFGRKMNRLPKLTPAPTCPITNNHARYRDPKTRLYFYNAAAFRELQRVQRGEYRWSKLLGAWVGSGAYAAQGVPERFLNPARCPTLEEVQRIERKREEERAKKRLALQKQQAEEKRGGAKDEAAAAAKEAEAEATNTVAGSQVSLGAGNRGEGRTATNVIPGQEGESGKTESFAVTA